VTQSPSRVIILLLAAALFAMPAHALFDEYNHPELKWLTFETPHFVIYYTEGLEDVASLAAKIAEEIHEPLCTMYDYRPDGRVSLIFSDNDDIANAAAYFQSNKIHFYATSMAWDFRGTHNWLRNVVTHEYTHMIQLGASRKWSRRVPALYVQLLGYEQERRPDVLYGYPNRLVSWPLPSVTVPAWLAEGTAQFQLDGSGSDYWDSHRDMLLRQATLSGRLIGFEDMSYFGKTSLQSEDLYNQGFSLTRYIVGVTGDRDVLRKVCEQLARPIPITISDALAKTTGKSGSEWYAEWKRSLEDEYSALRDKLRPSLTSADTVPTAGFVNLYPRLSPDGKRVAFISNQNRDYFGQSSLYVYDFDSTKAERLTGAAHGGLAWLPDNSGVLFTRRAPRSDGSLQHDVFLYRLADKKEKRLSRGLRAESVDVSPDGKWLVFTINEEGRRDLAVAAMPDPDAKRVVLTPDSLTFRLRGAPHEQYYLPRWSPDGRFVAVARHRVDGRDVCIFEVEQPSHSLLLKQQFSGDRLELRDPSWEEDGRSLLVSWDVSGIPNVYRLSIEDGTREQLTSTLGCAIYPDKRGNRLVYADFCENGFRIMRLDNPSVVKPGRRNSLDSTLAEQSSYPSRVPLKPIAFDAPQPEGKLYKPVFETLYWFPRIAFDYNTFKPGSYLLLNDVLEKLNFIGGFAINQKRDYDLFGILEYRALYPTVFAEYYNIQRRLTSHFSDSSRIVGEEPDFRPIYDTYRIRYRYSLHEVEAGVHVPVGAGTQVSVSGIYDRFNASNRFDDGTAVGITYFKGWAGKVGFRRDLRRPGVMSEINPSGGYKTYLE